MVIMRKSGDFDNEDLLSSIPKFSEKTNYRTKNNENQPPRNSKEFIKPFPTLVTSYNNMKTSFSILPIALLATQVAGQCSICPGGPSSISDIRATLVKDGLTCGEVDDKVAAMGTDDLACKSAKEDVNSEFNYAQFCCDDVRISNIACTMCEGKDFDLNRILPADTNPQGLTCGGIKAMADVTVGKDSFTCQNILASGAGCCDASCSVCPLGSSLGDPTRVLPGQETLTCDQFNLDLQATSTTTECTAMKAPYTDFDLASFCGCSGSRVPNICDYTQNCADGIADRSKVVSGSTLTCGNFERVADHIRSRGTCDNWKACCRSPAPEPASGALDSRTTKVVTMFALGVLSLLSV